MSKISLGKNAKILREEPWLWATRNVWSSTDPIKFVRIRSLSDLHYQLPWESSALRICFVHEVGECESVRKLDYVVNTDIFEVLAQNIENVKISLPELKHIVVHDKRGCVVYCDNPKWTFEQIAEECWKISKANSKT